MKKLMIGLLTIAAITFSANSSAMVGIATLNSTAALSGLGLVGLGFVGATGGGSDAAVVFLLGFITLDGQTSELKFNEVSKGNLLEIGLSQAEASAFLTHTEELELAFNTINSTCQNEQEAALEWSDYAEVLGDDAVNGLRKVLESSLK